MNYQNKVFSRKQKAFKISSVLQDFLGHSFHTLRGLDIGCADGSITRELAYHFRLLVGCDLNRNAISKASGIINPQLMFIVSDGSRLAFADESFDVVVCAQVYEHTENQKGLADEIWRIMRPGGICFFSGPNRFTIMEEHYWLPFLSWLPQPLANFYMRLMKKGSFYDIKPLGLWRTRRLWHRFEQHDYDTKILQYPQEFGMERSVGTLAPAFRYIPSFFLDFLKFFIPNHNWILVKPK